MRFVAEAPIAKRVVRWGALSVVTAALLAYALASGGSFRLVPLFCFLAIAAFSVISSTKGPRKPSKKRHAVVADATGLSVDGAPLMRRTEIQTVHRGTEEHGLFPVHVEGPALRRGCTVFLGSAQEAEALMAALELDGSRSTMHFRALPPWARHVRWLWVVLTASPWVLINILRHLPVWGIAAIAMLYGVIALPTLLPQRVEVGHDGLFLRWFGNKRFIPFAKIGHVSASKLGIDLHLVTGRHVEIRLTQKDGGASVQVSSLLARVEEGLAAHRELARADEEAFLARGERDLDTWLREMRALGAREGAGYRSNAIPRERLWAIVENPAADPSAREGAVLALSISLDDEGRDRLRALAQKTASPRLRIALDGAGQAGDHDEARLRVALEAADRELEEPTSGSLRTARAAREDRGDV